MQISISDHFTYRRLLRFTIPSIVMMIFTSIYGVVDGIFVSNLVGSDAFASVNLIMPFLMLLSGIGFMFGTGGSALVSKTLGEGKKEKANQYFSMLIYTSIIVGLIFTVVGIVFMKPIAQLFGAKDAILEGCVLYGRIWMIGLVAFMLQVVFQSFLIVAEKPKLGLLITISAGVSNMIGDFLFVYVFKLGLAGAAIATTLSVYVGGLVPLIYFLHGKNSSIKLGKAMFDFKAFIKTCANGSSEMLSNISMSLVNMLYNLQLMRLIGSEGVVAYGIIMYISFIFQSSFIGYSIGTAPITGYHYGAGNHHELKNILKKSYTIIGITSVAMVILVEVLSNVLAGIFVSYDIELMKLTRYAISIFGLSFLFSGFTIYTSNFFTSLNNGIISAVISFLRTIVFEISMVFVLPILFGANSIWFSIVIAEILSIFIAFLMIMTNRKKYGY